ncbi:MAG: AAA family ATPase [Bacilli bacterium]|nr:AAA family ATPase [Bacilli bacterium]
MNDYGFGNLLYELRLKSNLTQKELADKLGVTNKAISKWENGNAKPTTDMLKKLAILFNVPIEILLQIKEKEKEKQITKIVITGGPCAGKTTAMSWIQNAFTDLGYQVIFVPECATELINAGISGITCKDVVDFQNALMKLQIEREKIYEEAAKTLKGDKILIVCDRGIMDSKAYLSSLEFATVLYNINKNEIELRDNYDAIFHLVTAANGAKEFYTLENNKARTETIEEAILSDNKLIEAWTGHPHFRIIDNSSEFEDKMKRLIKEISLFLGEPEPYEIERKFLIEYPDITWLNKKCKKIEIIQTYLNSSDDEEIRVRQRGINGNYIYTQTIKRTINDLKRVEIEKRLSKDEYLNLLMNADTTKHSIRKTRYCLIYKNQYFEIDIYPFWDDKAIVEIELNDEEQEIEIPKQLRLIKEVTHDKNYKNSELAKYQK